MQHKGYFHRVSEQTATRFWINNVTKEEARLAIEAGAVGCTQNPAYTWKMLCRDELKPQLDKKIVAYLRQGLASNDIEVHLQRDMVKEIAEIFLPIYEQSNRKNGYVSIQGDPFHEDTETIVRCAVFNHEAAPNIMAKIPATEEGLRAIEQVAALGIPINATEVMAVRQALDVCEVYEKATKGLKDKAPIYFSHITGIFDEYLKKQAEEKQIDISPDALWQAGMVIAKKTYHMARQNNKEVGFISGGARGLHHFTEMVGADANVTINWKGTADKLLEQDPPVVQRFFMPVADNVLEELCQKLPDFRRGYFSCAIQPSEYEDFGPVKLFRESFEEAWSKALAYIDSLR